MGYQHILLVTDLRPDADLVASKAKMILDNQTDAKLSVLHIVKDSMVGFGYELIPASSLYEQIDNERCHKAKQQLAELLERHQLTAEYADVTTALSNAEGIVNYCNKKKVDLLIIGRHQRYGLSAFFTGATLDSILPSVQCDILVVRLGKPCPSPISLP